MSDKDAQHRAREREIDQTLRPGGKSSWAGPTDPAADDPVTREEQIGASLLGANSLRDGAIHGVSEPVRDGRAGPDELPDDRVRATERRNPPEMESAGTGDGGLSGSGGVAGGARGHGGTAASADPARETRSGPSESRAASRMDLDHTASDVSDGRQL